MTSVVPLFRPKAAEKPQRQDLTSLHVRRGYHVAYRLDSVNDCPGCRRSQWYVGRTMAECAYCETALPIERKHP